VGSTLFVLNVGLMKPREGGVGETSRRLDKTPSHPETVSQLDEGERILKTGTDSRVRKL